MFHEFKKCVGIKNGLLFLLLTKEGIFNLLYCTNIQIHSEQKNRSQKESFPVTNSKVTLLQLEGQFNSAERRQKLCTEVTLKLQGLRLQSTIRGTLQARFTSQCRCEAPTVALCNGKGAECNIERSATGKQPHSLLKIRNVDFFPHQVSEQITKGHAFNMKHARCCFHDAMTIL